MRITAHEVLEDIRTEFHGCASVRQLCEWFGAPRSTLHHRLKQLADSGHLWRSRKRYFSRQPAWEVGDAVWTLDDVLTACAIPLSIATPWAQLAQTLTWQYGEDGALQRLNSQPIARAAA